VRQLQGTWEPQGRASVPGTPTTCKAMLFLEIIICHRFGWGQLDKASSAFHTQPIDLLCTSFNRSQNNLTSIQDKLVMPTAILIWSQMTIRFFLKWRAYPQPFHWKVAYNLFIDRWQSDGGTLMGASNGYLQCNQKKWINRFINSSIVYLLEHIKMANELLWKKPTLFQQTLQQASWENQFTW
jgi:hypothetical protein